MLPGILLTCGQPEGATVGGSYLIPAAFYFYCPPAGVVLQAGLPTHAWDLSA